MKQALTWAAGGTLFLFAMTTLGAATVFLFVREPRERLRRWLLGFAAGIMTAASVWSLLLPAMDRAAALWGSRKSYFQVNGSTGGLLAAVRAATRRGDKVLLARHCHKAIYHAVEVCGLEPVFLLPPVEPTFGLAGSVTPQQVEEALAEHPEVKLDRKSVV